MVVLFFVMFGLVFAYISPSLPLVVPWLQMRYCVMVCIYVKKTKV